MKSYHGLLAFCWLALPLSANEPQRLGDDGRIMLAPAFANEQEIVYSVHESPNLVALVKLNLKDGSRTRVHPGITAHQFDAAYSRDGRWHCYAMSANSPQLVLVIQDLKEKQEFVFRPRDARAVVRSPSISPDGKRVIFSLSDRGGQQIASVNMRGEDLKKLTESAGTNASPAYSPDGKQIAFSSSRDGDFEIYVMDADGANVRRLTKSPGLDTRPAWSPDGNHIAFTSNRDGNYEIYVMNADGSGQRRLTNNPGKDDYPVWHPDGKRILFVSERKGKYDLCLLDVEAKSGDADGKNAKQLPADVEKWLSRAEDAMITLAERAEAVKELVGLRDRRCMPRLLRILPGHYDVLALRIVHAVAALDYPEALSTLQKYKQHARNQDLSGKLNAAIREAIEFCKQRKVEAWIEPMRKVHAKFTGDKGTFALFGDSITVSQAFWSPLAGEPNKLGDEGKRAHELVKKYMKPECWNKWRGPKFGNEGSMTIRWAHENVDTWLKKLNPEVAVIMFGTNDLGSVPAKEYEQKTREVVDRCLANGTVVILTTIPPRSGMEKKSKEFADIQRKIAADLKLPLVDYQAEILRRRPDDWNGSLPKFNEASDPYQVPTLIAGDGIHPSNPNLSKDYSEDSLSKNGYQLRTVMTLSAYADVIRNVLAAKK